MSSLSSKLIKPKVPSRQYPYLGRYHGEDGEGEVILFTSPRNGVLMVPGDYTNRDEFTVGVYLRKIEEDGYTPLENGTKVEIEVTSGTDKYDDDSEV